MQAEAALPSQSYVWTVLAPRLEAGLAEQKTRILDLCGLYDVFGPPGDGFTGELEANQTMIELTGLLVVAFAHDMVDRIASLRVGRKAGRPRDILTRELGPALLTLFLRYHPSAGRHSVLTSIDGRLAQEEAGPLFNFIKAAIEPLNEYLVEELHWKPLSAARLARYALAERRHNLRTAMRR
jgi:hypothetical protein